MLTTKNHTDKAKNVYIGHCTNYTLLFVKYPDHSEINQNMLYDKRCIQLVQLYIVVFDKPSCTSNMKHYMMLQCSNSGI
jgi:hypothetical protein